MKKTSFLIAALALLSLGFASCSTDPDDAVEKHVYSADESPYLRTDTSANIAVSAEFRKGHIAERVIYLKDYAEKIQSHLGMTVDRMLSSIDDGSVVFYNINTNRGIWDKTAFNTTDGWTYNAQGLIADTDQAATIALDRSRKAIIVTVPTDAAAGLSLSENVGFALNNGRDYDNYVRFSVTVAVTDPGTIIQTITIPAGDYAAYEVEFAGMETAISACFGMTVKDFNAAVQDPEGDIAMYMVDADGNWITGKDYTANGIGYWCDKDGNPMGWGDGCVFFVETHDGSVGIGRYPGVASGSVSKVHFVYASKSDPSKFMELVITANYE